MSIILLKPFSAVKNMSGNIQIVILLLICPVTFQTLTLDCFKSIKTGILSFFVSKKYSGKYNRSLLYVEHNDSTWILNQLMKKQQWSFQSFSDKTSIPGPHEQIKQPGHEAVFLFLDTTDSLMHVLKILKARRILKPGSRIFLVGNLHQQLIVYFQLLWKTLKIVCYIIKDSDLYGFDPLNNNIITSINCVENNPLQDSIHLQQYPVEAMVYPDNEPYATNDGDGICARSLRAFKHALNLKMNIKFSRKEDDPYTYVNGNEYGGQYRMMDQQQIDIVCGSQPMVIFAMRCCEILPGFISDEIVWVLPKAQKIAEWKNLISGFELSVWLCVITSWIISSLIFWAKDRRLGFLQVTVNVFGCFLGNAPMKKFKQFTWLFLLYTIVITSCYKSKLVGLMAVPQYERQFENLNEAAEAGLNALLDVSALEPFKNRYSRAPSQFVRELTQPGRYKVYASILGAFEEILEKRQHMVLMSKYQAEMVMMKTFLDSHGDPLVAIVSDKPLDMHMYASPANPLLCVFERHVLYLNEAGLANFWVKEMKFSAKLKFIYNKVHYEHSNGFTSISNLSGGFYLFLIGVLVACCFFVFECLVKKVVKCFGRNE